MVDIDELERLARLATRGSWKSEGALSGPLDWYVVDERDHAVAHMYCPTGSSSKANSEYIAAVNPKTVLELTDEIRRLRERIDAQHRAG